MMKSAYELAMERLERESGPTRKLSAAERDRLAEIDKTYDAKIAERRLEYDEKIAGASPPEGPALTEELTRHVTDLEAKREEEKKAVWDQSG